MGADIHVGEPLAHQGGASLNDLFTPAPLVQYGIQIIHQGAHMLQALAVLCEVVGVDGGAVVMLLHKFDLQVT